MQKPTRYREIEVAGTPREMGRQIGEAAHDEILGFSAVALERTNKTVSVTKERALAVASQCIEYASAYSPDMMEEVRGMSEGSGVSVEELMLLQVRNQFTGNEDPEAGCTSLSLAPTSTLSASTIVGQNWDNDPALDAFTVVLTRRPIGKPALMNVTQAGLIAYIGLNNAGIAACLNSLPAPSRPVGVPHYFTVRGIYETTSLEGAVEAVRRAHRAVPANIMLATPQGPADFEVTLDDVHVLRESDDRALTHTNHCLDRELEPINDEFPELIQSRPRLRRVNQLLGLNQRPPQLEEVKAVLSDHENAPRSICRHPNEDPVTGFWETVFSVIIEPDSGFMHISRGTPCDRPYETYRLVV